MQKGKIVIIILTIAIFSNIVLATDYYENYKINMSSPPYNNTFSYNFSMNENDTLSYLCTGFVNCSGTRFYNQSTNDTLNVTSYIPNSTIPGNYSSTLWAMINNLSNSYFVHYNFEIINDTLPYVEPNYTSNISVDKSKFNYYFCSYSMPYNFTETLNFNVTNKSNMNVTYDTGLFQAYSIENASGVFSYNLNVTLPVLSAGTYDRDLNFSVRNNSVITSFSIRIVDCNTVPQFFNHQFDECNQTVWAEMIDCIHKLTENHTVYETQNVSYPVVTQDKVNELITAMNNKDPVTNINYINKSVDNETTAALNQVSATLAQATASANTAVGQVNTAMQQVAKDKADVDKLRDKYIKWGTGIILGTLFIIGMTCSHLYAKKHPV